MRATICPDGSGPVSGFLWPSAIARWEGGFGLCLLLVLFLPGCKPKELQALLEPSEALSSVLADEAVRLAAPKKQVALITPDASWGPPSTVQEALERGLKKRGATVVIAKAANVGNPMFAGKIGLKGQDFLEALEKAAGAGAIISLVGAPVLKPDEVARVKPDHPPVLVVATAMVGNKMGVRAEPTQLAPLLDAKVIQLAIVDGANPPMLKGGKADPVFERFAQHYSILRLRDQVSPATAQ